MWQYGYTLWHSWNVMSHFNNTQDITFDVHRCNIHQGCHIPMFTMVIMLFINGYIALWHSSMVNSLMALSHCNIYWRLRWIKHSTFVHALMVLSHCDIHRELCWISMFIKEYIVVWQKKWFKPSTFYIVI